MDRAAARLTAVVPRGWLLLGMLGLTWTFVVSQSLNVRMNIGLAIALGGILLAYRALKRLSLGLISFADAIISWQQVAPLFKAAGRPQLQGSPAVAFAATARNDEGADHAVIEAPDLVFRYQQRGEPVLKGCSLTVRRGERLLLEGPSGGGKS